MEEVHTLTRLGLTTRQAKIYIALAKSGTSTVKTISKVAGVTREEIYRVIPRLQEWGLVEKIIDSPIRYTALPIQEGVSILMTHKLEEFHDLQTKTKKLIREFKMKTKEMTPLRDIYLSQFVLVPKKLAINERRKRSIESAQVSIDIIISSSRYNRFLSNHFKSIQKALERGVKMRLIMEKPENENLIAKNEKNTKHPCLKLRYIKKRPSAQVAIYDKKVAIIPTNPKANLGECPKLLTDNSNLLSIINSYFESEWSKAAKNQYGNLE